jgi:hypothetical protein
VHVEVGLKVPAAPPLENITVPVGGLEVPVTVTVHKVAEPTVTEPGRHDTLVVVDCNVEIV